MTGKTYRSILAAYAGGYTIICPNQASADRIKAVATHLGIDVPIQIPQPSPAVIRFRKLGKTKKSVGQS